MLGAIVRIPLPAQEEGTSRKIFLLSSRELPGPLTTFQLLLYQTADDIAALG